MESHKNIGNAQKRANQEKKFFDEGVRYSEGLKQKMQLTKSGEVFPRFPMYVTLETLDTFVMDLIPGDRVFLRGNLGAGKTTFAKKLIQKYLENPLATVTSPTYTYYQKYGHNLYHFDLYRIQHTDDLMRIGAEEIFDDETSICIIEWPEILASTLQPTITIDITVSGIGREIQIRTSDTNSNFKYHLSRKSEMGF